MKKKHLLIGLIILGFIGTVIFFPVNIGNQYTCLFHRIMDDSITFSEFSIHGNMENMHHSILKFYLKGFAYFWWTSILALVLGIYFHKRTKKLINF